VVITPPPPTPEASPLEIVPVHNRPPPLWLCAIFPSPLSLGIELLDFLKVYGCTFPQSVQILLTTAANPAWVTVVGAGTNSAVTDPGRCSTGPPLRQRGDDCVGGRPQCVARNEGAAHPPPWPLPTTHLVACATKSHPTLLSLAYRFLGGFWFFNPPLLFFHAGIRPNPNRLRSPICAKGSGQIG